jgi:hypothetical protein
MMAQLKNFQTGTGGDSFNGPVGSTTASTGAFTTLTTSSTVTHNGGTANGVAYLNGSKVLTTGSALVFDGTNLGVGITSPTVTLDVGGLVRSFVSAGSTRFVSTDGTVEARFGTFTTPIAYVGSQSNHPFAFYTNGTEKARIDSSGNLLVGTTSTGYTSSGSTYYSPSVQYWINNHLTGTASGTRYIGFGIGTGEIGSITQNGTTGVLYNLTSDYRLKNDQQPLTGAKDFVMALQPKKWQWWDGSGEGVGFVAHEFMEVAKYSGNGTKDAVDSDGKPVYQSIQPSSSEVMANLVAFIQEQQALITQLQADVATLKGN